MFATSTPSAISPRERRNLGAVGGEVDRDSVAWRTEGQLSVGERRHLALAVQTLAAQQGAHHADRLPQCGDGPGTLDAELPEPLPPYPEAEAGTPPAHLVEGRDSCGGDSGMAGVGIRDAGAEQNLLRPRGDAGEPEIALPAETHVGVPEATIPELLAEPTETAQLVERVVREEQQSERRSHWR